MLRARQQLNDDVLSYIREPGPISPKLHTQPNSRFRRGLGFAIVAIFTLGACPTSALGLPAWVGKAALLAGMALLGFKLLTFRRWADEHRHVPLFLACFVAMLLELSFENGMVWLASASDRRKYDNVPPLQDNVLIAVEALEAWGGPGLRRALRAPWVDIRHFLLAQLALAFSVLWEQVPYSGFGVMSRVVLTICASRLLRVACFMSTVLPSPWPGCYARRFPPVPDGWWDTVRAGYTTIRGFGGCNDLIFSGHGAFWVLSPLVVQTYYPGHPVPAAVLWLAFLHSSLRDVLAHQHYSVDMLLAGIVTAAVWGWLRGVYPGGAEGALPRRAHGAARDRPNAGVLGLIVVALVVAAVIIIGGAA